MRIIYLVSRAFIFETNGLLTVASPVTSEMQTIPVCYLNEFFNRLADYSAVRVILMTTCAVGSGQRTYSVVTPSGSSSFS